MAWKAVFPKGQTPFYTYIISILFYNIQQNNSSKIEEDWTTFANLEGIARYTKSGKLACIQDATCFP